MGLKQKIVSSVTRTVSRLMGGLSQDESGGTLSAEPFEGMPEAARKMAAEGSVLLVNDGVLPLSPDCNVALFGRVQTDWFHVGYGSGGDVRTPYLVSPVEGLSNAGVRLDSVLLDKYAAFAAEYPADHGFWGHWPYSHPEMPVSDEEVRAAAERNSVAVVCIGRSAGEDRDNKPLRGSYYLTYEEEKLLKQVTSSFAKTVVVLDIGAIMDMSWCRKYPVSALLVVWQGGMEAGNALADILTGKSEPGGRLTDTVAVRLSDYPSTSDFGGKQFNNYSEDIYVGYRYFETFAPEKVLFPFGAGMGYTTFMSDPLSFTLDGTKVTARVRTVNTGERAGREVVQLYMRTPSVRIPTPHRVLAAFAKTPVVAPAESVETVLKLDLCDFASFDERTSRYILEEGEYSFFLGGDVRSALPAGGVFLDGNYYKQVTSAAAPVRRFSRLTERNGKPVRESVPLSKVRLRDRILDNIPSVLPSCKQTVTLDDVRAGRHTLEQFVATLTFDELEAISRGDFVMNSPLGTEGNAGVLGGTSQSLRDKGVPAVTTTDGPSGLRLKASCSLLPSAAVLACSWDEEGVRNLCALLGKEMCEKGSDVILAPGMNIHRNPLCGRNFEYFSEDPLVTGKIAAAYVRGVQSSPVSACPKHFACNNQEVRRCFNDSRVSERALREIYLKGFEIVVKEAKPHFIMTSYNKINGVWGHYNYDLCTTVLRGEWGYRGAVMTDWWMRYSFSPEFPSVRDNGYRVRAQVDILMPGGKRFGKRKSDGTLLESVGKRDGMTLAEMQRTALNVLRAVLPLDTADKREKDNG